MQSVGSLRRAFLLRTPKPCKISIRLQGIRWSGYRVVQLHPKDKKLVTDFLRQFFYPNETLNRALNFHQEKQWPCMEEYDTDYLCEGLSLGAVSTEGKLLGINLNSEYSVLEDERDRARWNLFGEEVPLDASNLTTQEEKFGQILRVLQRINAESELFFKYPHVRKILDLNVVALHDDWVGKGIAKHLNKESRELARSKGFELARTVCTSHISASLCEKLGFHKVHELFYNQILDGRGQPVFRPPPPERAVISYITQV